MTAQIRSRFDQQLDYALVFQAWGLHLIAFALFLAALVGSDARGSKLLELESETARVTIGALGACVYSEGSSTFCQAASLTPQLSESYTLAGMPDALQRVLRTEVPDLPSLLLFVVIFSAVIIAVSTAAVLPRCSAPRTPESKLALHSRHLLKGCAVASTICAIFAVTVASCFFILTNDMKKEFNALSTALGTPWEASLRGGIPQLWAGCVLSGLAVLGHVGLILNAPPRQMILPNYQWS